MIIFDEHNYAENLLINGFSKHMSMKDLVILSRYYSNDGLRGIKLRETLVNFCVSYNPEYNEIISGHKIDKAISFSKKRDIRLGKDIVIYQEELEKIWSAGNIHRQKILFCMLVVARFFKNEKNADYYFNAKFTELLKIAKVHVNKAGKIVLMNELTKENYISPTYTGAFKLNYAGGEEFGIIVKDIENILLFFPIKCSGCKKICENITRRHGLCEECYKNRRNDDNAKKQKRYRQRKKDKLF